MLLGVTERLIPDNSSITSHKCAVHHDTLNYILVRLTLLTVPEPCLSIQAYQWMWSEFLDLEPQLSAVLRERESCGAAFKVNDRRHEASTSSCVDMPGVSSVMGGPVVAGLGCFPGSTQNNYIQDVPPLELLAV